MEAQREIILDPFDEKVIEAAKKEGVSDDWLDAAQRSPVYNLVKKWELALPLHPEFRTMPSLFYIPPLAPIITSAGNDTPSDKDIFDMEKPSTGPLLDLDELDKFRVPLMYLTSMFGAGNEEVVKKSLLRQLAIRHYQRSIRVDKKPDTKVLDRVGLSEDDAKRNSKSLVSCFFITNGSWFLLQKKHIDKKTSPYTDRGYAGFEQMNRWSPMTKEEKGND